MDELINYLESSVSDGAFSRGEKRSFKALLADLNPSPQDLGFLRSKLFDLAQDRVNAENFDLVLGWVEEVNKTLVPQNEDNRSESEVFFSPGEACRMAICEQLRSAISTVRICVFTISDDRITREIISAHKRGVLVRVLTDNDKSEDLGSDVDQLVTEGLEVKMDSTSNHMHHKFAVFDKTSLLTGSYNWTRSAARYNHENLLVSKDQKLVKSYLEEFDRLWREMEAYQA